MTRSGLASASDWLTRVSKPLKTERMTISAAVPTAIPATPMPEIMLMTLYDFRAKRYRKAILNGSVVILSAAKNLLFKEFL